MLYPERVLHAAIESHEGRFGQVNCQPTNANRSAALISPITFKRNISCLTRSTYQLYPICILSDNFNTLSLAPQGIRVWKCFNKVLTFQNRKGRGLLGRLIHLHTNLK